MPRILISLSGQRIVLSGQKPEQLARNIGVSTGSVLNLLAGKRVKEWQLEERERERETMCIRFKRTIKGDFYIQESTSCLARLLSNLSDGDEASTLAKKMLELGHEKYTRLRVLQDMNGAIKRGLVVCQKSSGAIY